MFGLDPIHRLIAPALLGAALAFSTPAAARAGETVADPVIRSLTEEGYTVTDVHRTWLGRILITAQNPRYLREIALDRRTGAILGDQRFMRAQSDAPQGTDPGGKGNGGTGGNAGAGGNGGAAGAAGGGGAGNGG